MTYILYHILRRVPRPVLVALLVLVALGLSRVLTPQEVFSGFSDTAVITILAIFVLAEGLEVTGIAEYIGKAVARTADGSETRLIVVLMSVAAFMSLFMNNIAAASLLFPALSGVARRSSLFLSDNDPSSITATRTRG